MIRKIVLEKSSVKKKHCILNKDVYNEKDQISKINQLYLNEKFVGYDDIEKCIKKKISSYKAQDKKKGRLDDKSFITYEQTLEKLIVTKSRCHYCRCFSLLMYKDRREKRQWTLDRLDNSIGHSSDNTVISCLECNLQKRCRSEKKFKFSKQMRLIKEN